MALFFLLFAFSSAFAAVWDGTANTEWYNSEQSSFTISTAEELAGLAQLVNDGNDFKGKTIVLANDIMLNDTTDWKSWDSTTTGLNSWVPIGDNPSSSVNKNYYFDGIFDGDEYAIFGIYINYGVLRDNQGLFGITGDESTVKNTGVFASYIKVSNGSYRTGNLVGNNKGVVENCNSNGSVIGCINVGGVVGSNSGIIKNSYSYGLVSGYTSETYGVGGVVGINSGIVDSSYSTSTIIGGAVGGVVGRNSGTVSNSYFIGATKLAGNSVGGVIGYNSGTVSNSYSTVDIRGGGRSGGVVGENESRGIVNNCYSTGVVYGTQFVGGVVGLNNGTALNCYSTGTVESDGSSKIYVGGIVGFSNTNSTTSIVIKNSVALNPSIVGYNSANFIGRILGFDYYNTDGLELSGNKAFRNMSIARYSLTKGHDKQDGEDITATDIIADGTLGGLFTKENGWTIENGKLPGLFGKAVDMPEHITNAISNAIQNTANATPAIKIWLNGTESFQIQGLSKSGKIRMFNIKGNILLNGTVQPNETISISHLPHGVYFVNVEGKTLRFVK